MSLAAGTRLGPYEVLGLIGAGGMGQVYRARDTKLSRDVALKLLPPQFAEDPEWLARFEREAKTLAALNHPHIAYIHGLEESAGHRALVMELVEGPTLADRVARGALPLDETLRVAKQLAEALECAHDHGVVHRDLKPANIKITPDGVVKVLDFGLAKALASNPPGSDPATAPTISWPAVTRPDVILGTAAYMSPEQARGKPVDRRADIWAFGCVLFEMLTGRRAFYGESFSDTLGAVMKTEPDWAALPAETAAPRLRELLRLCLAKDPKQRLRDIGDASLALDAVMASGVPGEDSVRLASLDHPPATWRARITAGVVGAAFAALIAAVLVLSGILPRARLQETRPLSLSLLHTERGEVGAPAISPDGNRVAYRARRADGMPLLWVRDLNSFETRPLAGTEDAYLPFWSPDSRHLGFFAGESLKRIPADGGPVQVVADSPVGGGGSWAPDGTIVFSPTGVYLVSVSAAGGPARPTISPQGNDWSFLWPSFLPDGRRFLFTAKFWTREAEASESGIYIGSLDSPETQRLLPDLSSAVYAPPGYVVFVRDGILAAAPFDLETGRLNGEPRSLGVSAAVDAIAHVAAVSAAASGTLALRPPPACMLGGIGWGMCDAELRLVDRGGTVTSTVPSQPYTGRVALAPDGRRVAAAIGDRSAGTSGVWLVDLVSGTRTPLAMTRGWTGLPVWSSNGARLAYAYQPPGEADDVYVKDLRTGQITPVIKSPAVVEHPVAWSHDGSHLLVYRAEDQGLGLQGLGLFDWSFESRTLTPFVKVPWGYENAVFSPDDRHVAFASVESGRSEVYVTTFPESKQTWQLTTDGGQVLSWRADGREILVSTLSGHIAAYPVSTEGGFTAGPPTILIRDLGTGAMFSTATPDHLRIVIRVSPDAANDKGEIRLIFFWAEGLRQGNSPR